MNVLSDHHKHCLFLLVILLIVHTRQAHSAPDINLNKTFYDISGTNITAIHESLQRNGPLAKSGKRFHASTHWNISWSYRWIESNQQCRLNKTDISVQVDMLLPRLKNRDSLDEKVRTKWDQYIAALTAHEQQHQAFGQEAANEIERLLLNTPAMNCFRMEKHLNERAQEILAKYKNLEEQFDRDTEHGAKDGVVLR